MNITFLIGNGFDLNLGLKTSYMDFFEVYTKPSASDSELIKHFKGVIKNDLKTWADAEIAFGEYTKWFVERGFTADDFYECYDDFCIKLAEHLIEQDDRLDTTEGVVTVTDSFFRAFDVNRIAENFPIKERDRLKRLIANPQIVRFINFNYTKTLDKIISLVDECIRKYPDELDKLNLENYRISQAIHVHGTTTRDMVLGVNDIGQICAPELFYGYSEEYLAQLIKSKADRLSEEPIENEAMSLIPTSDLIYIYGMSIGDTDKQWWNRIIDAMRRNKSLHLIISSYGAPQMTQLLAKKRIDWLKICETEKKKFITKGGLNVDKGFDSDLLERIHIDNANIFASLKDATKILPPGVKRVSYFRY